jgi:crotonobetainyl-CoA:carnitine CoA-transferase CaiB-like acyl-CoA transferase
MTAVMQGVRILEVAEHTFVPAASALLADWGAEVVKIEQVERGDAMRGLASSGLAVMGTTVHVLLEHSNRGKQSLALDLTSEEGLDVLYRLAATRDVFLTNKLPHVRSKLRIDVEHIPPTTRASSTSAAQARASAVPRPTAAPTTCSRIGAAPASPWA